MLTSIGCHSNHCQTAIFEFVKSNVIFLSVSFLSEAAQRIVVEVTGFTFAFAEPKFLQTYCRVDGLEMEAGLDNC